MKDEILALVLSLAGLLFYLGLGNISKIIHKEAPSIEIHAENADYLPDSTISSLNQEILHRIVKESGVPIILNPKSQVLDTLRILELGSSINIRKKQLGTEPSDTSGFWYQIIEEENIIGWIWSYRLGTDRGEMINIDPVNIYETPEPKGTRISILHRESWVSVIGFEKGYFKTQIDTGVVGYIPADSLNTVETYWNIIASGLDVYLSFIWNDLFKDVGIFTGYDWSWQTGTDEAGNWKKINFTLKTQRYGYNTYGWEELSLKKRGELAHSSWNGYYNQLLSSGFYNEDIDPCPQLKIIFTHTDGAWDGTKGAANFTCSSSWYQ